MKIVVSMETDLEYGKDNLSSSSLDGDERDRSRWSGVMVHSSRNIRRNGSQSHHGGGRHSSLIYQPTISDTPHLLMLLLST